MRSDLAKVIVERPRSGGHGKQRRQERDIELRPAKESMRSQYVNRKSFNEFFAPLKGILKKNINRSWAKVYSEINKGLNGSGTLIDHVRTHLTRDFVELTPMFDGKLPHTVAFSARGLNKYYMKAGNYYVDPHGILKVVTKQMAEEGVKRNKLRSPPEFTFKNVSDSEGYIKREGVWYRVTYSALPTATILRNRVEDAFGNIYSLAYEGALMAHRYGKVRDIPRYPKTKVVVGRAERKTEGLK